MRRTVIALFLMLVALPVAAQESDPFRSVSPPAFPNPDQDPFQMAPADPAPKPVLRPRPAPEPEPTMAMPPPPPSAPPPLPFDGIWVGTYSCDATVGTVNLNYSLIFEIKNSNWSRLNTLTTTPGQPGYDHYGGTIGADGHVLLMRNGVGDGRAPGGASLGEPISMKFAGTFQGDTFAAASLGSRRACRIQLTRRR